LAKYEGVTYGVLQNWTVLCPPGEERSVGWLLEGIQTGSKKGDVAKVYNTGKKKISVLSDKCKIFGNMGSNLN
jgi:hypothetical protein